MKKILAFLLALCMVLAACSAMAEVTYPIETSTTLTLWRVLDGSIVDGGYTTSMDTPGFKAWCEKTGMDGMARSYGLINWPGIHNNSQLTCAIQSQGVAYERWSDTDHDTHVVVHTAVLDEYLDEYTDLWTDIDLYINECRAKFISGEMSIENDFDTYLETLKSMNIDRVYEIKQITLDAHNAALAE